MNNLDISKVEDENIYEEEIAEEIDEVSDEDFDYTDEDFDEYEEKRITQPYTNVRTTAILRVQDPATGKMRRVSEGEFSVQTARADFQQVADEKMLRKIFALALLPGPGAVKAFAQTDVLVCPFNRSPIEITDGSVTGFMSKRGKAVIAPNGDVDRLLVDQRYRDVVRLLRFGPESFARKGLYHSMMDLENVILLDDGRSAVFSAAHHIHELINPNKRSLWTLNTQKEAVDQLNRLKGLVRLPEAKKEIQRAIDAVNGINILNPQTGGGVRTGIVAGLAVTVASAVLGAFFR